MFRFKASLSAERLRERLVSREASIVARLFITRLLSVIGSTMRPHTITVTYTSRDDA